MMTSDALEQTGETILISKLQEENKKLKDLLRLIDQIHGTVLMTDPPQDPWKYHQISNQIKELVKD